MGVNREMSKEINVNYIQIYRASMKKLSVASQGDRNKKKHFKNKIMSSCTRRWVLGLESWGTASRNELGKEMNSADLALDIGKTLRRAKSICLLLILAMLKPWEADRLLRMIEEEVGYTRQHVLPLNLSCPSFCRSRISHSSAVTLAFWHGSHLFFPGQPWTSPALSIAWQQAFFSSLFCVWLPGLMTVISTLFV